jgi:hypothetical protein
VFCKRGGLAMIEIYFGNIEPDERLLACVRAEVRFALRNSLIDTATDTEVALQDFEKPFFIDFDYKSVGTIGSIRVDIHMIDAMQADVPLEIIELFGLCKIAYGTYCETYKKTERHIELVDPDL